MFSTFLHACAQAPGALVVRQRTPRRIFLRRIAAVAMSVSILTVPALADSSVYRVGKIKISMPWSRATPKGADTAAGYITITNTGTEPDRLTGGSTPIADHFEIHEMSTSGGVMRMRELADGVELKPGETVELKPNGMHIMMVGLKNQVKKGDKIKATLTFEKAGSVDVGFDATGIGGNMPGM